MLCRAPGIDRLVLVYLIVSYPPDGILLLKQRIQHQDMASRGPTRRDTSRDLVVHRRPYRFIQLTLIRRQRDAAEDGVFRRQFGRHRGFRATQDERTNAKRQLAAPRRVAVLLDRHTKPAVEALARRPAGLS